MGRPLRYIKENTDYHVYSRCRQKEALLRPEHVKGLMEEVIAECHERYEFQLVGHVIMDEHVHFIIRTLDNAAHTISEIMKWLKGTFTRRYNRLMGVIGPFWNERFGAKVISLAMDAEDYLNTLLWYLAYNPVRSGAVKDPRGYKYGSLNHYLTGETDTVLYQDSPLAHKITLHEYFLNLAKDVKTRLTRFLKYEESFIKRHTDYHNCHKAGKSPFYLRLHRSFVSRESEKGAAEEMERRLKEKSGLVPAPAFTK